MLASNWADHYRQAHNILGTDLERLALRLCHSNSPACLNWLEVYGKKRMRQPEYFYELPTSLLIASYFGLDNLVNLILRDNEKSLDARGASSQRTALSWASEKGYSLIAQLLLDRVPKHQVILRDWLRSPTIVNRTDTFGRTPLWYAAANGHKGIVQLLLNRGAKVDIRAEHGLTPLSWAAHHGHNNIVALLLENGARQDSKASHLETRDRRRRTPLLKAATDGNEVVVQQLLDRGAKTEASDDDGWTALVHASERGHDTIVKQLLDRGAKTEASNTIGWTALMCASWHGHDTIVKQLLDQGAEIEKLRINMARQLSCVP